MIKIPSLNLNHFKIFTAVFESGSMTEAANKLHLTQSGISQHIMAFEKDLQVRLFTRVGRSVVPTPFAKEMYNDLEIAFNLLTNRFNRVREREKNFEGNVRIGMPIEFGNNVVIPKLSTIGKKQPLINFDITLDYAAEINRLLLAGELDFALADEYPPDRRLVYEKVATEELQLCVSREYLGKKGRPAYTREFFESLDFIEYKKAEPFLRRWLQHHLRRKNIRLRVRAHIMDVQGLAKFILSDLGAGILPDHLVKKLKQEGHELYVFEGKGSPLINEIQLVQVKNFKLGSAAKFTLEQLQKLL